MTTGEVHPGQNFIDNIWLQLAIGVGFPLVSYLVWGFIEIINVPPMAG